MKKERKIPARISTEILVAEDSITQAAQIKHLLESHHYKVSVAYNGKEAITMVSKHKPALVISDILMPQMNGYELCKKIKSNKNTEDIPVILLTRLVDPEEIIEGLTCGADSFITKPFNEKYLLSHIEKILSEENGKNQKKVPFGVQILFKGKKRFIQAEQQNVIKLMLDIYEAAIHQNERLVQTEEELRLLNERLESLVEDRTSDLVAEIKLSNQIAERLKESEERFRNLYNDAVVGLYRTNSQGEILLVNRAMLKMLGFQSFEELTARNIKEADYGPSYDRQQFIDQIEKEGEIKDLETIWICRDGKEIFVRENAKAIYDSEGKILYYDGSVEDITEQKKVAEALNKIQHLFETLAQASPVGIFRTDPDGNTTYVNPKWMELSGLSLKEAFGNGWLNAVHPDDRQKLSEAWLKNLKSKNESFAEYRFLRPDGSIIWVIGAAVPELIGNEVTGYIGTITDITEGKRTEKALVESETKYRQLVTQSPDGIFVIDLSGKFLSANKAICDNLKYTEEELLTMTIQDIVPEQYHSIHKQRLMTIMKGESTNTNAEYEVKGKDGFAYFVEVLSVPYYKGKEIIGFQGIARDITERKLMEDKLRSSEERLKILFDYAPDAYYLNDLKGNFIDGNIAAEKLLGYDRNELIGKSFLKLNLLSLKQMPRAAKLLVKNTLGQGTGPDEFVLKRRDGSKVAVEINTHPVKIKGHTLVLGMARDISERKQAEEMLRESESSLRDAQEIAKMGSWEWDIVTQKTKWSDNYFTILGFESKEVEPDFGLFKSRIHPDDVHILDKTHAKILLDKTPSDMELRLIQPDGTFIWIQNNISPVIEDDKLIKLKGVIIDITERKRGEAVLTKAAEQMKLAKEKAEAGDKLKTTFLNNISHEVRTPLNGILGFAEIMSQNDLSEEEKKLSHSMLSESSDRLLNTITNYMDISLITSGYMIVNRKDFVPGQIMKELLGKYMTICSGRKLGLLLKMPEYSDKLSINSDPEILNKILSHLLSNAVKFTEEGSIEYGYTIREKELEFFVADSGVGIGKESLATIFDRFIKEDRGPLKITEGSGLGLSISKGMVELLGGKIRVESEKGKGSHFFFTIPHSKENIIHHSDNRTNSQSSNRIVKSILVAEDDEINFFYLKALLKKNTSADIIHASNGREAIDKFKENPDIGLVLMDIKMPVMDGLEATRQIKAIKRVVPVIAITAYANTGDEDKALEAGCDGYISKPISRKQLFDKMAEYISL